MSPETIGRARRRAAVFAVVAAALPLAGCGWFSSSAPKTAAACPTAYILRPLANTATFGAGAERRPENVAFYGLLSEVDAKCDISADAVREKLDVIVIGQRGPAAGANQSVDFGYFVAVTGPGNAVLSKKPLGVRIAFAGNQVRAGITDHIEEAIPLAGHKPGDLNVVIGFQQSPDVVEFYRRFRGR